MTRSNTANGGTTFIDWEIQTVSMDEAQAVMRVVAYLTSLNVTDTSNSFSVDNNYGLTGAWYARGTLNLGGVYNRTPVWYSDFTIDRVLDTPRLLAASFSWSGVNYWGTTLSAYVETTIPAATAVPDPPTVAVTSITPTSAVIYVSAAGSEHGLGADYCNYRVHRTSDGAWMGDIGGPGIGYGGVNFGGLARGTAYVAYAQTHNAKGYSGWSGGAPFTTASTAPDVPGNVTYSSVAATSFITNFTAAVAGGTPVTGYQLQIDDDPSFGSPLFDSLVAGGGQTITGLIPNTTYYGRVRANSAAGFSAWSTTTSQLSGPAIPSAPGAPVITAITLNSAQVDFAGSAANGSAITGYRVQASLDGFATMAYDVTSLSTSRALTGLSANATYQVRVYAINGVGGSAFSPITSFLTSVGLYIHVGANNPRPAVLWQNVLGTQKAVQLWQNVLGTWKQIG